MRLLFIDGSTHLETVDDLKLKARGGMVTSLFKVTDYLAQRHDVSVLSDIKTEGVTPAGVKWFRGRYEPGSYDVLIANRGIGSGYPEIDAKARVLWTHDLPHAGFIPEPKAASAFTCVFMSEYAEKVWRAFYRDIGKSVTIPNGVDKELFHAREKDLSYLIYASAPNRGLKQLPFIFDAIQAAVGRPLKMKAFSNLSKLHPGEGDDTFDYDSVRKSNIELCDPVPQAEFADEIGRAGLMILPSQYPEICSNAILQSLASCTPVVTTGRMGSAHEWVTSRNGATTEFQPHDYVVYTLEIIRNAVRILNDAKLHRQLIQGARETRIKTWDEIGALWERMLKSC